MGNVRDMATEQSTSDVTREFREARDFLVAHREDYETAYRGLQLAGVRPVQLGARLVRRARGEQPDATALWVVEEDGEDNALTFAELAERSSQVASFLRGRACAAATGCC